MATTSSSIQYIDLSSLNHDLHMWMAWRTSDTLTLAHLPKMAAGRWSWIADNWIALKKDFLTQANGDETLINILTTLDNNVIGWKSGSKANPLESSAFFDEVLPFLYTIQMPQLIVTPQEEKYISEEIKRVSLFTSENFKAMLRFVREVRDGVFDRVGLGDEYYSSMKGRTSLKRLRDHDVDDLNFIQQMIDLENFILGIILDFKNNMEQPPNLLAFAQSQLAEDSQVAFQTAYQSFIQVPFGTSLEQMAQDYLGSKTMWYELVTVNGLKPPYVDVTGIKEPLLETGAGISVHVNARYAERMRIGSKVKVGSRVIPEEIRKVEAFTDNKDGTITLLLSGASDLNKFREDHSAYLRLFSPETIQDFTMVKIPFNAAPPSFALLPQPETQALKNLDKALYAFGVDVAMSEDTADLLVSQTGDLKIRYGLSAVRQAVWNALRITKGQLPLHPSYGIPDSIGENMYGGDSVVRLSTLVQDSLSQDSRYTSVAMSNLTIGQEQSSMTMNVAVAGDSTLVPFSYSI